MKIYKYDIQTKEFLEELEINEAYGINLPFTTTIKPLIKKDGFAIFFNGTKWEYVEDNRDKTAYIKDTKEELKVDYLGKIKDEHALLVPKQFDKWDEISKSWIEDIELKNEFITLQKKAEKELRLSQIVVTTLSGNTFDGNDLSQSRMVSAIVSAKASSKTEIQWKLANNEIVLIQIEELEEALALAIGMVGEIITEIEGAK